MKNILLNNLWLKISAILIAVCLWFFVTSRGQSEMSLEIPLEFTNLSAGLGIVGSSAKTGVVTVKGQERLMKTLKPSDVRVYVDLGKARKGEGVYYINKDDIRLPYSMTVMSVAPSSLKVRIDETVEKNLLVRPLVTGEPAKGLYVQSIQAEPRSIKVRGLQNEVRKLVYIGTEPVDITGASESVTQHPDIDLAGANIKAETATVKVHVEIGGKKR